MRRDRVRRLGIVGVMLGLVCLGVAGERAAVLDDSQFMKEIVATKVRARVLGQGHGADRDRKANSGSEVFSQLQGTLASLQAMVREGLDSEPDPARFFTRTFLSGAVFEGFVLEVARDGGVGRLRSRIR